MRPHTSALLLLTLTAALSVPGRAPAQLCTDGPPTQLGTINVLGTGIPGGTLPNSTATVLGVACAGIPLIGVHLQIDEPPAGVPYRGTIMFSSGAQGAALYSSETFGLPLYQRLHAMGFRLVDRFWVPGWFEDEVSVRKQSCRYATVVNWVHQNVHLPGGGGPFMVVGSSGGAAEISYGLTTWGIDAFVDVAVLTGGPPMARWDLQCPDPVPAGWAVECQNVVPKYVMNVPYACTRLGGFGLCTKCASAATPTELREDSILHTNAQTTFPNTRVHQMQGADDFFDSVPSGMLLFNEMTGTSKVMEFIPAAPHFVVTTPQGLEAVVRALLGGTTCRATMAWREWPEIDGDLIFDLDHGNPSEPYHVMFSAFDATIEIPAFGVLCLGNPLFLLGSGLLDASGQATFTFPIPNEPGLIGFEVFSQALVGHCLTNLTRYEFVPATP